MKSYIIINGPNLNMLGIREKEIYGTESYSALCAYLKEQAMQRDIDITMLQSNIEGEIINFIQQAYFEGCDGIIINPGAYTHYSYAIADALKSIHIPTIEVHLSNVHDREKFRQVSVTAPSCIGQICGFGFYGYVIAMDALLQNNDK
jgi:3-dehydroquinate dehydratase-2